ncbi:MAG: nucleoside triphosphate pyrophosphohydrolase [Bacteroidetes bacterium]|nr:nucleoside triphosphate pyrophosphohydrolase [Bacteroidota bacterium]
MRKTFLFNKIIRDKLYKRLSDKNIKINQKELDKAEFTEELKNKLSEEALEVKETKNREELTEEIADVLEVIYSLLKLQKIDLKEIEEYRQKKYEDKGGFETPVLINSISLELEHPDISYYLNKKEEYPEIIK